MLPGKRKPPTGTHRQMVAVWEKDVSPNARALSEKDDKVRANRRFRRVTRERIRADAAKARLRAGPAG